MGYVHGVMIFLAYGHAFGAIIAGIYCSLMAQNLEQQKYWALRSIGGALIAMALIYVSTPYPSACGVTVP